MTKEETETQRGGRPCSLGCLSSIVHHCPVGVWFGWGISQHLLSFPAIMSRRATTAEPALASLPPASLPVGDVWHSAACQRFLPPLRSHRADQRSSFVAAKECCCGLPPSHGGEVTSLPITASSPGRSAPLCMLLPGTVLGASAYLVFHTTYLISVLRIIKLRLVEVPLPVNGHIGPTAKST